jgi:ribosomal protein L11 methyltransferase
VTVASDSADATPERWLALSVDADSSAVVELLVEHLLALGARGVQEAEGRLIAYLPPPDDVDVFIKRVQNVLREMGVGHLSVSWRWQEHEDWSVLWRQGLGPREITDRLVIAPSWCEVPAAGDAVVVTIDPGMAFGTAEHETTRGSLRLLDHALSSDERLLDAGCGSGILAISAARLGARRVLAVDVDPYACEAARENAELNGVSEAVDVEQAAVTAAWLRERGSFDGILANIQPTVLVPLLEGFAGALEPRGWLILSGITEEEWADVSGSADLLGLELKEVDAEGEWRSGRFTRALR